MLECAYLSREACTTLGIIPSDFPRIGSATQQPMSVSSAAASPRDEECDCSCPIHTKPPPLPTALPFPATDANWTALQNWILDRYQSSTFNTCECQTLPLMESPPLELHVDPDAKPIAVHKPIPVPLHWQQEVKESIDRDVKLGVLEAVPVGKPVTWCHRMVTAWKKNGKPRRTVDMQVLNKHAVRETHHTQSPFLQATLVPAGTKKTITDAWNGYHSVPIREGDRHLTTFITPWGRYRYKTCPQGCFTGRIHQKIRRDCQWLPQQNQMHRWHMLMGRHPRRKLLSNMSLARHLRSTRNCSESRNVCIWLWHGGICWFRHHTDRYPAQWQTYPRNPWLSYATKHHWYPILVWPHQPSIVLRLPPQQHGAFPRASQDVVNVLLGWSAATSFWAIKGCYTRQNHRGCPDIRLQTCHMSRHRLVQERHRFLALAAVLHLWGHHSCLLLNGIENSVRW